MDYASLFDAMHGARWLLSARPASTNTNASVNVLTLPTQTGKVSGLLIPIMLASTTQTTLGLTLYLGPAALKALGRAASPASVTLSVLLPGHGATPKQIGRAKEGANGEWESEVPLIRGCAMVTALLA